jgi:cell division inhibitor SepF
MGVYLGLVEDDDARGGYDRYAARQSDYDHDDHGHDREYDRGYDRYPSADRYDGVEDADPGDARYGGYGYGAGYEGDYPDDQRAGQLPDDVVEDDVPRRAPEPEVSLGRRPAAPRTLNLAGSGSTAARLGGGGVTPATASPIGAAASARGRLSAGGLSGAGLSGGGLSGGGVSGAAGLAMSEPVAAAPAPVPAPAPAPAPEPKPQGYRITTVHPASYNEARTIGERFRDGMPVIMNLTDMEHADAKRLVDFAIGLTFGLRGSIERVTAKVFLLSPQDVDVTAEDKARIREGGFFSQS